jgi:hypothetical protein
VSDERRRAAVAEAAVKVINAVNALAQGIPPSNRFEHVLADTGDIAAAIQMVVEAKRRARERGAS